MEKPPFTPEQIKWLEENQQKPKPRNTAWNPLKEDVEEFVRSNYGQNPHAYALSEAIKTIIRFHVGVSTVRQIDDNNAAEAKDILEVLKAHI